MKEDFLHYIWKHRQFEQFNLKTVKGEDLYVANVGVDLGDSGPDFFNAQIQINGQKWAGNIEIHVKASDWYLHQHQIDVQYDNVILHVVWDYDIPVFRSDQTEIPVLLLSQYTSANLVNRYQELQKRKKWIYCENQIASMDSFALLHWKEQLYFERLERKVQEWSQLLNETKNHWERVLFCLLAKGFGLNVNGAAFLEMAVAIPYEIVQKERRDCANLESLFFGSLNMLPMQAEDSYVRELHKRWNFLSSKYQLRANPALKVDYFRLRPLNFPSIRIAQFAALYVQYPNLYRVVVQSDRAADFYKLFRVEVSPYWTNHNVFDKAGKTATKKLTKSFVDLLIVNTVVPFKYAYYKARVEDQTESLLNLVASLEPEENGIISRFRKLGLAVDNAFDTQALIQLKKNYCDPVKCLNCAVGKQIIYGQIN